MTSLDIKYFIYGFSWITVVTILQENFETKILLFKRQCDAYDARAKLIKISRKMFLVSVQDKLLEIENFDKYARHKTKFIVIDKNEYIIILIY